VLIQRLLYQHAIVDTRILTTEYWFWTADLPLITNTESGRSGYSWIVRSLVRIFGEFHGILQIWEQLLNE